MKYKVGDLVLYRPRPAYGDQEEGIGVIYKYAPTDTTALSLSGGQTTAPRLMQSGMTKKS